MKLLGDILRYNFSCVINLQCFFVEECSQFVLSYVYLHLYVNLAQHSASCTLPKEITSIFAYIRFNMY